MRFEQAILNNDYGAIKNYIKNGVDIDKILSSGFPPISVLITPKAGLQLVPHIPNEKIIRLLIENNVDVNKKMIVMPNNTPLIQASYYGFSDIANLLLDNDVRINDQNIEGATALMMATMAGQIDIVKKLLSRGADKSIATFSQSLIALDGAYRANNKELINILEKD